LRYFSLEQFDNDIFNKTGQIKSATAPSQDAIAPEAFDFWVFNWHFITMASSIDPERIRNLPGKCFTIVLELAPDEPLKLVPPGVFDGYLALDPSAPNDGEIFAFPRPLESVPRTPSQETRAVPVIGSFGFGTPGKGFELLVEAVNRSFDQAIVRVNIPSGDYIGSDIIHKRRYGEYLASVAQKIAKPGIDVQFTFDFMSGDELISWCGDNDLNCFMYTRCQPGLSATTDQAITSGRPLVTLSNDTFRHIHQYIPPYPVTGLRAALEATPGPVRQMQSDWSAQAFGRRFEDMLNAFGLLPSGQVARAGDREAPVVRLLRIAVISPGPFDADQLGYPVRIADSLSRTGQITVTRHTAARPGDSAPALAQIEPDLIIATGYDALPPEIVAAELNALSGRSLLITDNPLIRLHCAAHAPDLEVIDRPPIIPFHTVTTGLAETPAVWLIGFEAPDSNLESVITQIRHEVPNLGIRVDVGHSRDLRGRVTELKSRLGRNIHSEVLPATGDALIEAVACEQAVVIFNNPARTRALEDIACLCMTTERPVLFTQHAPFRRFGEGATCLESATVPDHVARGIGVQIRTLHDLGEWQFYARILRQMNGEADRTPPDVLARLDQRVRFVSDLFQRHLSRAPDPDSLNHFIARLELGHSEAAIRQTISQSVEAQHRNPSLRTRLSAIRRNVPPMLRRVAAQRVRRLLTPPPARVELRTLAGLVDQAFVRAAYLQVLRREPDAEGLAHHLALLRAGRTRTAIVLDLARSAEGRAAAVPIRGLRRALWTIRLGRLPALGAAIRWLGLGRDPYDVERALGQLDAKLDQLSGVMATRGSVAPAQEPGSVAAPPSSPRPSAPVASVYATASLPAAETRYLLVGVTGRLAATEAAAQLFQAWRAAGVAVQLLEWNLRDKQFQIPSAKALSQAGWDAVLGARTAAYPTADNPIYRIERASVRPDGWLVLPGIVSQPGDRALLLETDILIGARRVHLRSVGLFDGADPLRRSEATRDEAYVFEQYTQALLLADAVITSSPVAQDDLTCLFTQHQSADFAPPLYQITPPPLSVEISAPEISGGVELSYIRAIERALADAADASRRVGRIYLLYDPAAPQPLATLGLADQLADQLAAVGGEITTVVWDATTRQLQELEASGEPVKPTPRDWLLVVGPVRTAVLEAAMAHARTLGLRTAGLVPEAAAGRSAPESGGDVLAPYAGMDKAFTLSPKGRDAFYRYLLGLRQKLHSAEHRFEMIPGPWASGAATQSRPTRADRRSGLRVVVLMDDDARQTAQRLVRAVEMATDSLRGQDISFDFLRPGSSETSQALDGIDLPRTARWLAPAPETGWGDLLRGYDVAVSTMPTDRWSAAVAACAEAGLPLIAPLSNGAAAPGAIVTDFRYPQDIADAVVAQSGQARRRELSAERLRWPGRSWRDLASDLLTALATDRLSETVTPLPDTSLIGDVYARLPNLKRRPKLSLCISTYNRAGWIGVNLRNIFEQIDPDTAEIEVLVVDNTSTDNTEDVVRPFLPHKSFRYLRNPVNVGMLGNLAVTAQRARGAYVWILGDDDLTRPGAIADVLRILREHPEVELINVNYGYTSEKDPASVTNLQAFLSKFNILEPDGPDELATVNMLAAKNENFYTAIYSHVYRRDHALRSYCQDTSGRTFSTMRACIPTTYYVLHYMADRPAYWMGRASLVVNSNVSWADYGAMLDLEHLPDAWDLAERRGAPAEDVDRRRANRLWLVEMMWRELLENDKVGNSAYVSPPRVLMRLKHLPEFEAYAPEFRRIYTLAHAADHPAAKMAPQELFSAFA
jgi:hypothetical protein